ncbi:hypothetical protein [Shimazuella alba]|uniref:Uncharacterized protein n=1 Tax=Shimazuella alba TaxID=2690964 RepID=A0A6I4VY25_9BACL|nr:hypothetical protein [Shimazuella alba]MXQ54766.1 hypothetical protein [Shimazuella alba]
MVRKCTCVDLQYDLVTRGALLACRSESCTEPFIGGVSVFYSDDQFNLLTKGNAYQEE